jgi:hypothetical protein
MMEHQWVNTQRSENVGATTLDMPMTSPPALSPAAPASHQTNFLTGIIGASLPS